MMSRKNNRKLNITSQILDRVIQYEGLSSDTELAKLLDVEQNTVSTWRTRDAVPYKKIIEYCDDKGISLDFIFKGQKIDTEPNTKKEVDLKEKVRQLEARMALVERILTEGRPEPGRRFYDPLVAEKK